jgi:hypothetical protein
MDRFRCRSVLRKRVAIVAFAAVCAALTLYAPQVAPYAVARAPAASPSPSPTPSPTPDPLPSGLTADDVFFHARQVATTRDVPRFVEYHIDSAYHYGSRAFVDRFDLRYRDRDRKVVGYTIPLSPDEDRKRLAGINILFFAVSIEVNPDHNPIVIKVPLLSPVSDFGLAVPPPTPAPGQSSPPGPPLREIGRVITRTHEYDVTYVGKQTLDGRATYHLKLKPAKDVKDAWKHRLRDVWVDTTTFDVPQLQTSGILEEKPYDRATWRVNYERTTGNAWVVRRISCDDDLNFGDVLVRTDINGMAFGFHDFDFPVDVPTALFDLAIP